MMPMGGVFSTNVKVCADGRCHRRFFILDKSRTFCFNEHYVQQRITQAIS